MTTSHPWKPQYPEGTPPEIAALAFSHLPAFVRGVASHYADAIAFTQCMPNGMNGSLRYRAVDDLSDAFAAYLREECELQPGDRVALQMPNCLSYPIAAFGVFKAGGVLVNTNPLYTASEMTHQYADSGAQVLVIIDMFADRLPEVLPKTDIKQVITVKIGAFFPSLIAGIIRIVQRYWDGSIPTIDIEHTPFEQALAVGRKAIDRGVNVEAYMDGLNHDALAALQYTGGTTGVSKGATLSHGNLLSNTRQMIDMIGEDNIRPGKEVVLTALPLYHVFAFTVNLLGFFDVGARNILIPSPRPPSNLKRAFENYRITWMTGVNTLFSALLKERWFLEYPPDHLRASAAGGMALHTAVAERWREVTGTEIIEGYGLTEASPVLSFNPLAGEIRDGTIGIPVPSTEMRIVDETGAPVPPGTPGEIVARGPQVMKGYWQRPEANEGVLKNGWLHTGDIGVMDADGYFTIVDRKKDMILVSGFNVFPNEVEDVMTQLEGIAEAAVIGVPDEKSGEQVRAYVVAEDPAPTAEEIIGHCRKHLAAYKVPKSVEYRKDLPKSLVGKILRKDLRAELPDEQFGFTPESVVGDPRK